MSSAQLRPGPGFSLTSDELGARTLAALATEAERLGYTRLFNAESVELDAVATAAAAVAATSTALVGTGVVNVFSRTPFALAMAAATLADLSDGRFALGLGTSSAALVEGAHGTSYTRPLTRTAETVEVVRALLRGETVHHTGRAVSVPSARLLRPPRHPVPIVLAAVGPHMLELAGRVADGVLLALQSPESVRAARAVAGTEATTIVRILLAHPGDDAAALAHARRLLAGYVAVPAYAAQLRETGYAASVERVAAAFRDGGRAAAAAALDDDLLADRVVVGTVAEQRARLARYRSAGAEIDLLTVVTADAGSSSRTEREQAVRDAITVFSPA